MLRYTGTVADGWLKNRGWPESPAELDGYVVVVEQSAQQAGRDPLAIRRVLNGAAGFGDTAVADAQARARGGAPAGSGNGLLGSPDQMLETIQQYRPPAPTPSTSPSPRPVATTTCAASQPRSCLWRASSEPRPA